MTEFKLSIGDPKSKKSHKAKVSGSDAEKLVGKKIGEKIRGEVINAPGYELEITGGSDSAGFPMRKDVNTMGRAKALLSGGVGFKAKRKGQRKRKTVRGNTISDQISQVNLKVIKAGKDLLEKLFGEDESKPEGKEDSTTEPAKEEPKEEEKPAEEEPKEESEPAEEQTEEAKPEEPKKESEEETPTEEPEETTPKKENE